MRTFLKNILIVFAAISTSLYAQIPNSGFEEWNQSEPINWKTSNLWFLKTVSPTEGTVSGSSAIKLTTLSTGELLMPATVLSGADGSGFPVNQRHEQLSLYYKFSKTNNTAYLFISVGVFKNGEGIGGGVKDIITDADNFTALNIPIEYFDNQVPDSAIILIMVTDQFSDTSASGSCAVIDDVSFNVLSDVDNENINPENFKLEQNFPNPFNPETNIKYSINSSQYVSLKVYDVLGNEIADLINEEKHAGVHEVKFNGSDLASGIYFYKLQTGGLTETKKMLLMK
jgi:hypothetical protein